MFVGTCARLVICASEQMMDVMLARAVAVPLCLLPASDGEGSLS